jgi:pyruvate dehydrogenase (quinone)
MKAAGYIETGTDLENPDFAAVARAAGIHAVRVEDPAELERGIEAVLRHPGPALLDVVTNPQELSIPPKIKAAQVMGMSLWAAKAVMSGRGDELIDVARSNFFSR